MKREQKYSVIVDAEIGKGTVVQDQVNLYKCMIGKDCKIDAFVYIEEGVEIGDECKIRPFTFIPTGVKIGNRVFIGPNVTFTNDKYPKVKGEWELKEAIIESDVSIGAGATILPGIKIGKNAVIGAGAVVTKDVHEGTIVAGHSAKEMVNKEKVAKRRG